MKNHYVNLTVNPCKMCKPMGATQALMGIEGCMVILHGSQGCSTYIRRHMATHYNEPIDIASSSLNEHGTVYGGAENLIKGIKNLIALYNPKAVGILTTCLAETIGEDINRIIKEIPKKEIKKVKLIPVSTAGYSGTHTDGFESAARAVVETLVLKKAKNNDYINIIPCEMSCADIRFIKETLNMMKIKYVMLPDISQNLDRPYMKKYERLALGGTKLSDIKKMSGAKHTLSIGIFTRQNSCAAHYLYEKFGVPYTKIPMPVGFENSVKFFEEIAKISGKKIPAQIEEQKGRIIDAMIDSHKYNASGRAAIFGEPELVYSAACCCIENGILPVICATGSKCKDLKPALETKISQLAAVKSEEDFYISDDADFSEIEEAVNNLHPNILIGSSDARRIEEKTKIPLIRTGFPIHDRVGGQRRLNAGFAGSLNLLDEITNALIKETSDTYRAYNFEKHFKQENGGLKTENLNGAKNEQTLIGAPVLISDSGFAGSQNSAFKLSPLSLKHPCFNCGAAHTNARLHLPIAPACNISCNYCLRKYDCANESRPGIASAVLSPQEALQRFIEVKNKMPNLTVVGIAGPGDALANFKALSSTLNEIRKADKDIAFCISTNGLMLPFYADDLVNLGVSHATVTINAVDPAISEKIYSHINYFGKTYTGAKAAEILLKNQLDGLRLLSDKGVICKVNTVVLSAINEAHITDVVNTVKEHGAAITNIMQMIPVKGTPFENLPLVNMSEINKKRKECEKILPQMFHCRQCRADAAGLLNDDKSLDFKKTGKPFASESFKQENKEICKEPAMPAALPLIKYAVASKSGILIDLHFGMADEFYIYEYNAENKTFRLAQRRSVEKYCGGKTDCGDKSDKIGKIIFTIKDCAAVLCMRIGDNPAARLSREGISVYETYDRIEDGLKKAVENKNKDIRKVC